MIAGPKTHISIFALMVDKLRLMDEGELKHAYSKLIQNDLEKEWEDITKDMNFGDATDEDIVKAVKKKRVLTNP